MIEQANHKTEHELLRGAVKLSTIIKHKYCEQVGIHLMFTMGGTHDNRCVGPAAAGRAHDCFLIEIALMLVA